MKIAIASDHGGFELKQKLLEYYAQRGTNLVDLGAYSNESCDYPLIARKVTDAVLSGNADWGILV